MLHPPTIAPLRPVQPPRRLPQAGHRNYLDGARALAALWVVLSHLWIIPCGLEARVNWLGPLTNWTLYSHFAVDIFIVLSGFCLILPVAHDGHLPGGTLSFFGRRARRILPPFYAALLFSVLASLVIQALNHQSFEVSWPAVLANAMLLQDVLPALNIFNGPFWSIAVEWRIYWVFPALVWILGRFGPRGVLAVSFAIGGAMTLALLRLHPEMVMACPWYLGLFATGLCAGSASAHPPQRGETLICAAAGILSLTGLLLLARAHPITPYGGHEFGTYLPLLDPLAGVSTAALLLWVSRDPKRLPLLSWRPLVSLGTWAYSLYLVHLPCLLLLNALVTAFRPLWRQPLPHVYALMAALPLVFGAARLFYLAFEKPFLSRRQKPQQRA